MKSVLGFLLALLVLAGGALPTGANEDDIHIAGIVLDPAGKPLPSVKVLAYSAVALSDYSARRRSDPTLDLPQPDGTGTTGVDGRFRFPTKTAGLHGLRVDPPGAARAVLGGVPAARGSVPSVVVKTERPTTLEGFLVDPKGKPLAGARVCVLAGVGNSHADLAECTLRTYVVESDASGRWAVSGVRPAEARIDHVTVRLDRASPIWFRYSLGSSEAKGPIVLGGTASVRFRLLDPDGEPVAGRIAADVMTERVHVWFLLSTGVDGTVVLDGLPAGKMSIPMAASKEMRNANVSLREAFQTTFELVDGKLLEHEIRLEPTRVLEGTVVDDKGKPIVGATVRPPQEDLELPTATSDAEGRFRLVNVRHLDAAQALAEGYVPTRGEYDLDKRQGTPDGRLVIRLTRFGEVSGLVLTPQGKPAVGWTVTSQSFGFGSVDVMNDTITGEDGRFLHPSAMVGALVVTATGPEYALGEASATVAAGKRTEGVLIKTKAP